MIEPVHRAAEVIDIGADHIGLSVTVSQSQIIGKPGNLQHQILFDLICGRQNGQLLRHGAHLLGILAENGLDADDGIEDIGAGVALKGRKPIHIKGIVLGGQIAQVAVFQGCHSNDACDLIHGISGDDVILQNSCLNGVGDLGDQIFQPHNAAAAGLEGLAILAVHGAEAQELQLGLGTDDAGLLGGTEHLLKV